MPLRLNGVEIDDLRVNGVQVDGAFLNGVEVFRRGPKIISGTFTDSLSIPSSARGVAVSVYNEDGGNTVADTSRIMRSVGNEGTVLVNADTRTGSVFQPGNYALQPSSAIYSPSYGIYAFIENAQWISTDVDSADRYVTISAGAVFVGDLIVFTGFCNDPFFSSTPNFTYPPGWSLLRHQLFGGRIRTFIMTKEATSADASNGISIRAADFISGTPDRSFAFLSGVMSFRPE